MKIHLPAETWEEVLNWLNRRKFAKKMEQLWDREFTPIAEKWLHEWSRNNKIGRLEFKKDKDANQAKLWKSSPPWGQLSIATVDMPKNICSFEHIRISYLDNTVLAFLRKMQPLLHNIHLSIDCQQEREVQVVLDHLLPMFRGDEFEEVVLSDKEIPLLNGTQYSSPLLNTKMLFFNLNFQLPCFELLANWLFTKRADGEPRMLSIVSDIVYRESLITIVQERFMAATEAFPFIIRSISSFFGADEPFQGRTIKNVKTGQQLIMREREYNSEIFLLFIISCSLDMNNPEEQLAKWEQKMLDLPECNFLLLHPTLGPLDPINQKQQSSGSSSEEAALKKPSTSKMG